MFVAVGLGVDGAFHPFAPGVGPMAPIHVKTIWAGIELDPGAGLGTGVDDSPMIDLIAVTLEQEPTGKVAQDMDVRVAGGGY